MLKNIRHTGIVVRDLEASLAFYTDVLGLYVKFRAVESGPFIEQVLDIPGACVETVKLGFVGGENMIELLHYRNPVSNVSGRKINDVGISHIALTVESVDAMQARLKAAGIDLLSNPRKNPEGTAKVVFCRAPEGTYIELVEVLS